MWIMTFVIRNDRWELEKRQRVGSSREWLNVCLHNSEGPNEPLEVSQGYTVIHKEENNK